MKTPKKWTVNVSLASKLVGNKNKKESQMRVVDLALEVCEITWGGKQERTKPTLKEFAHEIGVNYKTLSNWAAIKRNVYDILDEDLRARTTMIAMVTATRRLGVQARKSDVNRVVRSLLEEAGPDNRVITYVSNVRSLLVNVQDPVKLALIKKPTLEEIKWYCQQLIQAIDANVDSKIVGRDHGLISDNSNRFVSTARAGGVSRVWRMNENDKKVLDFLHQNHDKAFNTIDISRLVFKGKTPMANKLAAMRSLTKLKDMGHIARDERLLFRFKNFRKA
jgi:hypothetical protein